MKFKKGDRVSCRFGFGEIVRIEEPGNFIPYNFYHIKLENEKYSGKLLWFAEHELKLEKKLEMAEKKICKSKVSKNEWEVEL